MRDLEWFLDEGPELARLGHYVWTDRALNLNHVGNGHTLTQMRRLDGLVFPGVEYRGAATPSVILICPKEVFGLTIAATGSVWFNGERRTENDKEGRNDWYFTLRSLFTTYYARRRTAQRLGNLTVMPEWTTTVRRNHVALVAGPDGAAGEVVRHGVAVG